MLRLTQAMFTRTEPSNKKAVRDDERRKSSSAD